MPRDTWLPPGSGPALVILPVAVGLGAALVAKLASGSSRRQTPAPPTPGAYLPPGLQPQAKVTRSFVETPTTPSAPSGSFAARVAAMSEAQYRAAVLGEALAGNIPQVANRLAPIRVTAGGRSGIFWCASMPLCVGTDAEPFHAPLSAPDAQRVADALGMSLPTRRMVDAIHEQAAVRVPFRSFPSPRQSPATYAVSSAAIEQRRAGRGGWGAPVSDFAKDYVLTRQRRNRLDRIAIYGGWDSLGTLVQPLGTPHALTYFDYSQQPRFVAMTVEVDGVRMGLHEALADPATAPLFSDEGTIAGELLRY